MFYVYALIDPRDNRTFYVGKGKGARIQAHEAEARAGRHSAKCHRIREIWEAGETVVRKKLSLHECENEALQAEFDEISRIGLSALTNVVPGGRLGQEVYLRRLEQAQARKKANEAAIIERGLRDMAPKFADVLRHNDLGNDYGAWVGSRWIDFREALLKTFDDMVAAVGTERAKAIMAPHGVVLVS